MSQPTKYFIIDGLNLAYRVHNVNFELHTATGVPSGMFYGFVRMLFSLKKKYRGYKFVVVWDNRAHHKFELQPDYKSGRSSLPSTISSQIPDIREYLTHCGVDQCEKKGQEADDVIASLVKQLKGCDTGTIIVYSNDKDFLQLVETGKVIVFKPKVGHSPEKFYDEDAVYEKFGVPPTKLAHFRSFDGDKSDTLIGVPRVPRKIIASLINKYGDIGTIYDIINDVKLTDYQRKAFSEARDRVAVNLLLIELNRNLTDLEYTEADYDEGSLSSLQKKYEVKSINPKTVIDLFSSSLNMRYTEPRPVVKLEPYSLF